MRSYTAIALAVLILFCAASCSHKPPPAPPPVQQPAAPPPGPPEELAPKVDLAPLSELNRPAPPEEKPKEPVIPAVPPYRKGGLQIKIKSDRQLNLYQGRPHALTLCIYQLKDPNQFLQASEKRDGIEILKRCELSEASIANAKMEFVQPGKDQLLVRDRAEGAKYLGFVAGYSGTASDQIVSLSQIPPKSLAEDAKPLSVELSLGPDGIAQVKVE